MEEGTQLAPDEARDLRGADHVMPEPYGARGGVVGRCQPFGVLGEQLLDTLGVSAGERSPRGLHRSFRCFGVHAAAPSQVVA
ncbi:MAG TPA: hypothetical protein VFZ61_23175 [Polyangiales bacterium]